MISHDMYTLLKMIPKPPEQISHTDLFNALLKVPPEIPKPNLCLAEDLLTEARKENNNYIICTSPRLRDSYFSLNEYGLSAIEEYERRKHGDLLATKAHKTAKYALWVAIVSAIAAVAACIIPFILK